MSASCWVCFVSYFPGGRSGALLGKWYTYSTGPLAELVSEGIDGDTVAAMSVACLACVG